MAASNLAMILPVDLLKHIVDGFHEGDLVVLAWNWTDPLAQFRPLSSHNPSAHSDGFFFFFFFLLLTPSQHYLLYPRVVSTSSTCERLSLRCIINRGRFVEPFAVRLVSTSRRPNYRRDRLSFCLARSFSRFPCLPLHAALAMHDDATISLPRHFSILCCSSLDGHSFSTQKVFSMPASALDLALYVLFFFFFLFFYCMVFWCFLCPAFFSACYYCFSSTK